MALFMELTSPTFNHTRGHYPAARLPEVVASSLRAQVIVVEKHPRSAVQAARFRSNTRSVLAPNGSSSKAPAIRVVGSGVGS